MPLSIFVLATYYCLFFSKKINQLDFLICFGFMDFEIQYGVIHFQAES